MEKKALAVVKTMLIVGWYFISTQIVYFLASNIGGVNLQDTYYLENYRYILTLGSQALFLLGLLIVAQRENEENEGQAVLSFRKIVQYILMGVAAYFICSVINILLGPLFPDYEQIGKLFNEHEKVSRFLAIVIGAPFVEEYLFRNKIQGYLKQGFPAAAAIIGQAALFGLLHQLALQKVYALVMGLLFGMVKETEKQFASTLIMHMTINFIGWCIGTFVGVI